MRRCEWLARVLLVFVVSYGVVAVVTYSHQAWPFFAWNLFTKVPAPTNGDYNVRIVAAQGLTVKPPVYFEDARLQTDDGQRIQGYQTLQNWGRFTKEGADLKAAIMRQRFESLYLSGLSHVRYEFVHRVWDIRKRVRCRSCFVSVSVLDTYTAR